MVVPAEVSGCGILKPFQWSLEEGEPGLDHLKRNAELAVKSYNKKHVKYLSASVLEVLSCLPLLLSNLSFVLLGVCVEIVEKNIRAWQAPQGKHGDLLFGRIYYL